MEKKTKNRIIGLGVVAGTAILTAAPFVAVRVAYDKAFNRHISTYDPLFFSMDDFPSLRRDKHIFASNNKQKLTGYMYYYPEVTQKAVIVLSHGYGGGGQRTYLDCTNYLAKNGFYVFAYDASGTDESEGKMGGFPQGIIDVNHAIDYVSSLKDFKQYPIFLFGHSWGAYSASNALAFHPEIKAIVAVVIDNEIYSTSNLTKKVADYKGSIDFDKLKDNLKVTTYVFKKINDNYYINAFN